MSWAETVDLATVTSDRTFQNGDILQGTLSSTAKLSIAAGATITLNGVNINWGGSLAGGDFAGLNCVGNATIVLADGSVNYVKGFMDGPAGIHIAPNYTVTISGNGTLNVATKGGGAAIGSGYSDANGSRNAGNIVINGGTIYANGGNLGAGIGGGGRAKVGNITINGGIIFAVGGGTGAGIGGGQSKSSSWKSQVGNITIKSSIRYLKATKGSGAAHSIGKGSNDYSTLGTVKVGNSTGAISTSPYVYCPPADNTKNLINAIGTVEYTAECKAKIDAARAAYDGLEIQEMRDLVTNYSTLTDAEAAYNQLVANEVIALINKIPQPVEKTLATRDSVRTARLAYDALTAEQKLLVSNYTTLTDAEAALAALDPTGALDAARAALDLINALPDPVVYPGSKAAIDAARDAYDALSNDAKDLISAEELKKLTDAEDVYEELRGAALADVIAKIDALPATPLTEETTKLSVYDKVVEARAAFDALTAEEQAAVTNLDKLEAIEAAWAGLINVAPAGALSGKYTINAGGDVIYFAHGNLQYTRENLDADWSTGTFRLATNQYDLIEPVKTYPDAYCTDNYGDKTAVGLFGWGTWGEGKTPNLTSSDKTIYTWSTDFSGTLEGTNTWRTLSKDEWVYLLEHNNLSFATVHGVNGMLVAPDGKDIDGKSMADWVEINDETWTTMQNDGYLFLPACGQRSQLSETSNITTGGQGEEVIYYSSTEKEDDANRAYNIWYEPGQAPAAADYSFKRQGFGVRLVSAGVNPLDQAQAVKDLIDAIPVPVTLDAACVNAIQAARDAYDALADLTKGALDEATVQKLTDAEAALTALNQAEADKVIAKIDAIPQPVELKLATRDSIQNARTAYDALNAAQQALVTNYQTLLDAEATMAGLNPGGGMPAGALSGKFTINAGGDQVAFSKGNLQATTTDLGANWTWGFAANQWNYLGIAVANSKINGNGTVSENGTVDLFGWSTAATYYGINNSYKAVDYIGDFVDWGPNMGAGWRTLTKDEWNYLIENNTKGRATVNDKNGYIFLPNDWSGPAFTPDPDNFTTNVYSGDDWTAMEDAGAVFLPSGPARNGTSALIAMDAKYCSSTSLNNDSSYVFTIYYNQSQSACTGTNRAYGCMVRLVSEGGGATPLDSAQAVKDLIDAIPVPVTLDSKDEIDAARDAYDALADLTKGALDEATVKKFTDAEDSYAALIKEATDVIALINAIPQPVVYNEACGDSIAAAREAYDALSDELKPLVTNYPVLTDAEDAYEKAKAAKEAAEPVIVKINNIPQPVELKLATRDSIQAARAAFDALTDVQMKDSVTNYQTLLDAEAALAEKNPGGGMPAGALSGKFTINEDGDQIAFSKGNLQATTTDLGETWTWGFAANQWDLIGNAAANNAVSGNGTVSANGTVDLFGWSTPTTYYGIHNSENNDYYSSEFREWGENITGATWKTLRPSDWIYIISNRADAAQKQGQATVNGVNGYIFLPDDWELPSGLSFTAKPNNWTANVYDGDDWTAMENAGAVFLPKSPWRKGNQVNTLTAGYYWSSDYNSSYMAMAYTFQEDASIKGTGINRYAGIPVRLVTAGGASPAPLDSAQAVKDLIDAIPVPVTLDSKDEIDAARDAYDALADLTKGALDEATVKKFTDAEDSYAALIKEATDVIALINAIPQPVVYNEACGDSIAAAREAYDALSDELKPLVTNYPVLTDAETAYAALKDGIDAAIAKIDSIPVPVEYTAACKDSIEAARAAYDNLTEEQKDSIPADELQKLIDAEVAYAALAAIVEHNIQYLGQNQTVLKEEKIVLTKLLNEVPELNGFVFDHWYVEPTSLEDGLHLVAFYRSLITVQPMPFDTLMFNGLAQNLIAAGEAEVGHLEYRIGEESAWSETLPQATNAGVYAIQYKLVREGHEDYIAPEPVIASIAKVPVTYTAPTAVDSLVYNASAQTLIVAGLTNDGTFEYTTHPQITESWTAALPQGLTADSMAIYFRIKADANHLDSVAPAPVWTYIAKAALTATADNKSVIYGDAVPAYTVTYAGWLGGDTTDVLDGEITYACEYTDTTSVGDYTIFPYGITAHNYAINFVPGKLTVGQAPLTITADKKTVEYGEPAPAFTASYNGWRNKDSVEVVSGLTFTTDYLVTSNVGHYTIVPSGATALNYAITFVSDTLTVTQAPLTITADKKTVEYGEPAPAFTASYEGWKNKDSVEVVSGLSFATDYLVTSNVGHYNIVPSGATALNYAISFVSDTLTVTQAPLMITADNKSVEYGETAPAFTASYSGWKNQDSASVVSGLTLTSNYLVTSNVGTYDIVPANATATNYAISYTKGTLTVNKAPLTITADNKSVEYGEAAPAFTASYSGWKNQDSAAVVSGLTLTSEYLVTSNVGTYAIVPANATATNYAISFVNGKLTVNRAPLTITADDKSVEYGEIAPAFTASYEGWKNNDTTDVVSGLVFACDYLVTSNVGEYVIKPDSAKAQNYAISFVNGKLTVNQAPLMITADNKSVEYGETAPAFTASYSGWKNSDDASVVSGLTLTSAYLVTSNVGTYDIVPDSAKAQNYAISFTNGTLTVNKAPLTITAEDKTMIYGDEHPEFTATYAGWKNTDDASVVSNLAYTCAYAPGSYIGTYAIEPNSATAQNYAISFVNGTLTVNKAVVSVSGAEAQIAKFADGHANAVVLNSGKLNGIKLSDPIAHVTTATFSSADVAENLTITLFYELTGEAALLNNYNLQPTSEIFTTEGVIIEPFHPDTTQTEEQDEDQTEVQEGIDVYAFGYCDGSGYSLKYHLNSGNPDQYKIDFADSRFTNVPWTNLVNAGKDGTIDIEIPVDMPTGDYSMTVYFRDSRFTWLESQALTVSFHVNLPETYVRPLFDNTIALVDTCNCFTDIQWYHRNNSSEPWQAIEGANGHYYRPANGEKLSGEYFVSAKMNGVPTYTCGQDDMTTLYGAEKKNAAKVRAFPNPVVNTTTVTIEGSDIYEHTLRVVNINGWEVVRSNFEGNQTTVEMGDYPQGNYMISVDGIVVKVMKQ